MRRARMSQRCSPAALRGDLAEVINDERDRATAGVRGLHQFVDAQRGVWRDSLCARGEKRAIAHVGLDPDRQMPRRGQLDSDAPSPQRLAGA
jgi:hypothetical protein